MFCFKVSCVSCCDKEYSTAGQCVGSVVKALLCSASSPEENVGGDVKIRAVAETWLPWLVNRHLGKRRKNSTRGPFASRLTRISRIGSSPDVFQYFPATASVFQYFPATALVFQYCPAKACTSSNFSVWFPNIEEGTSSWLEHITNNGDIWRSTKLGTSRHSLMTDNSFKLSNKKSSI